MTLRHAKLLSTYATLLFGALTAQIAHASVSDTEIGGLPVTFWATAILTVGMAVTTGYTRGLQKRITSLEFDSRNLQTQISGVREMVRGEYPHRNEVATQLAELKAMVHRVHDRLDDVLTRG